MSDQPPEVVALDLGAFTVEVDIARPTAPHRWQAHRETPPERLVERLEDATVAVSHSIGFSAAEIAALPRLELIACCATGLDHVDLAACEARGIAVTNAADYASHTVAEHAFGLILALRRNLPSYLADVAAGSDQQIAAAREREHRDQHGGQADRREDEPADPSGGGLEGLFGDMFETGRQVQDNYARGVESIFEQYLGGMKRR